MICIYIYIYIICMYIYIYIIHIYIYIYVYYYSHITQKTWPNEHKNTSHCTSHDYGSGPQNSAKVISDGVFEHGPGPFLDTSAFE